MGECYFSSEIMRCEYSVQVTCCFFFVDFGNHILSLTLGTSQKGDLFMSVFVCVCVCVCVCRCVCVCVSVCDGVRKDKNQERSREKK